MSEYYMRLRDPIDVFDWYEFEARIKANSSSLEGSFSPFIDYNVHQVVGILCASENDAMIIGLVMF